MHAAAAQYRLAGEYSSSGAETSKITPLVGLAEGQTATFGARWLVSIPLASPAQITHHAARARRRDDLDPTRGKRRSSTGSRDRNSRADGEHYQFDNRCRDFRDSGNGGDGAWSRCAACIRLLRNRDGVVRDL